jgi:hypothetical protein
MTFNSCQKEEEYAMNVTGKVVYENLIDLEHLHYEHIVFALEAHSELIKQRMLAAHAANSGTRKSKQVEQVLIRISQEAKETIRQEVKANPIEFK